MTLRRFLRRDDSLSLSIVRVWLWYTILCCSAAGRLHGTTVIQ